MNKCQIALLVTLTISVGIISGLVDQVYKLHIENRRLLNDLTYQRLKTEKELEDLKVMYEELKMRTGDLAFARKLIHSSDLVKSAKKKACLNYPSTKIEWSCYLFVLKEIRYSHDPLVYDPVYRRWFTEFWKTPEETLMSMSGDCEDKAILYASMLLDENMTVYVFLVRGLAFDHALNVIVYPDKTFRIVDPTIGVYTNRTDSFWKAYNEYIREVHVLDIHGAFSKDRYFLGNWQIEDFLLEND